MIDTVTLRRAGPTDADTIARIHAESWRSAYRGIVSDAYLDGPVVVERQAYWRKRISDDTAIVVLIADVGGTAAGFIAWVGGADPQFGGIIDNFHMLPTAKGKGVGRKLFDAVWHLSATQRPGEALFLWVLEANEAARAAYVRLGGTEADRSLRPTGDGGRVPAVRVVWRAPVAIEAPAR
jgi:ribosomal protein S18 acetylase RimI-like enzyme